MNVDNSNNRKRNERLFKGNKLTIDIKAISTEGHSNLRKTDSNKNANLEIKNSKPHEDENFLDPDITISWPIGHSFKSSTQIELKEKLTHTAVSTEEITKNHVQDSLLLDPDLTLRSPIGPPSTSSTPQGPASGEEPKEFTLAHSPEQKSQSILSNADVDGLMGKLLPEILAMEGEVVEETQPKSPTILTRSRSFTRTSVSDDRKPKRKRDDVSFGSLFASKQVDDSTVLNQTKTKPTGENENGNQCSKVSSAMCT